jgi:hypothetical protein
MNLFRVGLMRLDKRGGSIPTEVGIRKNMKDYAVCLKYIIPHGETCTKTFYPSHGEGLDSGFRRNG